MNKRTYLVSPHMSGDEMKYIKDAFDKNWITSLGENVDVFEQDVCRYTGAENAVALASGTGAIHMALKAVGVSSRDVVFCSSLTFAASANPIVYQNATPVFIDSEKESYNMSPKALEKAFEKYIPKAVIVVNLYGQSADMDKILEICNKHNVPVIEDAAESLGATYKGKQSGTLGKFGIYSFNGNKIITTSGGGILVSDDEASIKKVKFWSTQSRENERHYEHKELGFNYRMSNILAGIGRGQMEILSERITKKKEIYEKYEKGFEEIEYIEMCPICDYGEPNYWLSVITLKKESKVKPLDIIVALEKENIESRPIWKPLHIQPVFEGSDFFNHNDDGISVSEDIFNRGICLPSDTKMTDEDMERIIGIVKKCFE